MRFWKHVHLDGFDTMRAELLQFVHRSIDVRTCRFWNELDMDKLNAAVPELNRSIKNSLGTEPWMISAIVLKRSQSHLHVDHVFNQRGHQARLNLPLLNCENSQTVFYDVRGEPPMLTTPGDQTTIWDWKGKYEALDRVVLNQPTILRVRSPHAVFSFTSEPRIAITINLEVDPASFLN